jgi:hypothetical protein
MPWVVNWGGRVTVPSESVHLELNLTLDEFRQSLTATEPPAGLTTFSHDCGASITHWTKTSSCLAQVVSLGIDSNVKPVTCRKEMQAGNS